MTITVNVNLGQVPTPPPTPSVILKRVRKWGDPAMVPYGFTTASLGTLDSNFQAVGLYNKVTGFGGVSNFIWIDRQEIDYLISIQKPDQYGYPTKTKMNWLVYEQGGGGSIYFRGSWETDPQIAWGTIALGGNLVQVAGYETLTAKFPNRSYNQTAEFARLAGMKKYDISRTFKDLYASGLIHRCYCAYRTATGEDRFDDTPKGIVYSPFWDVATHPFNVSPQPNALYIPTEWLEEP